MRRKPERQVDHRYLHELEELVLDFEAVRGSLVEGLKAFDPRHFR
jgi:hypothetical protein